MTLTNRAWGYVKFFRYFVNLSEVALYVEIVLLHLLAILIGVDDDQGGRPDGSVSLIRERDFSTIFYYKGERRKEEGAGFSFPAVSNPQQISRGTNNSKEV